LSPLVRAFAVPLLAGFIAACGGGGGGGGGGSGPLNITSTTVNDGVVGNAYNDTVDASGGKGTRTFSVSAGSLPGGLALSSAGAITGTPQGPTGIFNFSVSVTDSANQPATDTQALTIDIVDPLSMSTAALANTSVGAAYNATIVATGGTGPYTFTVVAPDTLPAGLSLSAAGAVTGTSGADARSEVFVVQVSDSSVPLLTDANTYEIDVTLDITTTALPDAVGGEPYSASIEAEGGLLPLTWSLTAGALPAGLGGPDPATGEISGTPDAVCVATATALTVQVTDTDTPAQTDTQGAIGLAVVPAALDITSSALPNGTLNTAYNASVQVSGGVPPYSFAVTAGALPNQLSINAATGQITGTPDTLESQAFDVTVTDACPDSVTQPLGITITNAALGRNNSIADATALPGNGSYAASISPSGHPNTVFAPDEDYYAITTTAASIVTVNINAQVNGSPLDSVIELVDANGNPLITCVGPTFTTICVHDDEAIGVVLDSFLEIQVSGPTTFYIHIVDWASSARPDKFYDLVISGVN
jgi:hypothetical protein